MTLATIRADIDDRAEAASEVQGLKRMLAGARKDRDKYQQERDTARGRCKELESLLERMGARRNAAGAYLVDAPTRKPRELTEAASLRADLTSERAKNADLARALRVIGAAPQLDRILARYAEAKADDPGDR